MLVLAVEHRGNLLCFRVIYLLPTLHAVLEGMDRGELAEVASDDELNSPKRAVCIPGLGDAPYLFQGLVNSFQKIARDHTNLVDDEDMSLPQTFPGIRAAFRRVSLPLLWGFLMVLEPLSSVSC